MSTQIKQTEALIQCSWALREMFDSDPHRPRYHFMPPSAWMNDVNGAIHWKGRHHVFYQHNPDGAYWKWMQWGHASSVDLVHWVHHPIALTPTHDGPDRDGCYSGGAFLSKEGKPTFIYHGVPEGTCIATSEDDLLIHWYKHPNNPVIPVPKPGDQGHGQYIVFDPCAWVDGNTYYALIGNRVPGRDGDGTSLFWSADLAKWEYVGPFYESDRRWTDAEEDCAVPDFFALGDKHMLLFCSHLQGTQYYLGRLHKDRFEPDTHGRLSWPGGQHGGCRSLLDPKGRRVFFDWIQEVRGVDRQRISGWAGVMTIPRILALADDGALRIEPVPELDILRRNSRVHSGIQLSTDEELPLDDLRGDCLELAVEMEPHGAETFGVMARCSPDGAEQTRIVCVPGEKALKIDVSRSTLDPDIHYFHYRRAAANERLPESKRMVGAQTAPFELADGEALQLRIFLDRSVLEVFANGRQCLTQRVYPTRGDSLGMGLFSQGGRSSVRSIRAWDMAVI